MSAAEPVNEEAVLAALDARSVESGVRVGDVLFWLVDHPEEYMRAALLAAQPHLYAKGYEQGLRAAAAKLDDIDIQQHGKKWCVVDTSTAEPEVNWPGDLISDHDTWWQAFNSLSAAILTLIPKEHSNG